MQITTECFMDLVEPNRGEGNGGKWNYKENWKWQKYKSVGGQMDTWASTRKIDNSETLEMRSPKSRRPDSQFQKEKAAYL